MKILEVDTEKRRIGNLGENAAAALLKKKKYKILERNFADSGNEIDIIAENKECVAFVEVKTRSAREDDTSPYRPASSVTPDKMRKIIRAARYYAARHKISKPMRLDVIEVYLSDRKITSTVHMEGAFTADTARKNYTKGSI